MVLDRMRDRMKEKEGKPHPASHCCAPCKCVIRGRGTTTFYRLGFRMDSCLCMCDGKHKVWP